MDIFSWGNIILPIAILVVWQGSALSLDFSSQQPPHPRWSICCHIFILRMKADIRLIFKGFLMEATRNPSPHTPTIWNTFSNFYFCSQPPPTVIEFLSKRTQLANLNPGEVRIRWRIWECLWVFWSLWLVTMFCREKVLHSMWATPTKGRTSPWGWGNWAGVRGGALIKTPGKYHRKYYITALHFVFSP